MSDPIADIRRELLAAAERQAASVHAAAEHLARHPSRGRLRESAAWRRGALVVAAASLLAAGVAFAASRIDGAPVPRSGFPLVGGAAAGTPSVLPVREPDPGTGPPWGLVYYLTKPSGASAPATCLQVGRIVDGRLGVLGQDGAFSDDHLFHPLPVLPAPCTSAPVTIGPAVVPASGLAGPAGFIGVPTSAGGCAIVTPNSDAQSARRAHLANRAARSGTASTAQVGESACPSNDLRILFYGVVTGAATSVELYAPGFEQTQTLPPGDHGGFLFVLSADPGRVPNVDQFHLIVH